MLVVRDELFRSSTGSDLSVYFEKLIEYHNIARLSYKMTVVQWILLMDPVIGKYLSHAISIQHGFGSKLIHTQTN
ncbi:MAG TPA: hypothetical protein VK040_09030 [Balneolaceae bacterium]|nr:hypothetical protein [Balneolaceae bacterium]